MTKPNKDIMVKIENVKKAFGPKQVLKGVDLEIPKGKCTVIIGGSGSGKSVLLKCILGLMDPDSGHIYFDGKDTVGLNEKDHFDIMRRIGMCFQFGALFDSLTNWQNVGFGLIEQGKLSDEEIRKVAIEKLQMVGLDPYVADQKPADLSGGMRKRVAVARAICLEPEVIIYDEPTTGLDPITTDIIDEMVLKLKRELGITSIIITHDMKSAFKTADHMAMLYQGEIVAEGDAEFMKTTDNPYVRQFIEGSAEGPIGMPKTDHRR